MRTQTTPAISWLTAAVLPLGFAVILTGCNPKDAKDDSDIDPALPSTTLTTPQTVTASGALIDIVSRTEHLSMLNTAIVRAGLADKLKTGTITLFAPTNDAFKAAGYASKSVLDTMSAAKLQRLLQYHLLDSRLSASTLPVNAPTNIQTALVTATVSLFKASDGQLYANASHIVQPDIGADKSVMYVIDRLLTIPSQTTVELVSAAPELSLFRLAIERVGSSVSSVLLSPTERGITVFAPSNAAFRAAGYINEDAIRSADVTRLGEVLRYHIVNSRAFSPTLRSGDLATAQGTALTVSVAANRVTVTGKGNPAVAGNILQTDLTSTNGVVHIIDRVLLPTAVSQ